MMAFHEQGTIRLACAAETAVALDLNGRAVVSLKCGGGKPSILHQTKTKFGKKCVVGKEASVMHPHILGNSTKPENADYKAGSGA